MLPEFRGQGIGRALLAHVEAWGRAQGCTELATDSTVGDDEAQSFHRHMGFGECDRIVQYRKELPANE